ncbi:MAG: cupin domain-containing protein [Planctomycetes bacterium]|nr:cupin domain-containing protein [Planctomycetota bacterium]
MVTAEEVIQKLDLKPLPYEGGFYRETYKSNVQGLLSDSFGNGSKKPKQFSSAIYYMVTPDEFSSFHRLKSDEIFHFYAGDLIEMVQIDQNGNLTRILFGSNVLSGAIPQVLVPCGVWQAIRLQEGGRWALMGTTVSPAFEFEDFELGNRERMISEFPEHKEDILRFTREHH